MTKRIGIAALVLLGALTPLVGSAATATADYAMFKRSIAPTYAWGENGVLTIPKAQPIGRYNLYGAASGFDAGSIQGEKVYNTKATFVLGTSEDVEIGYTKNQLIWNNGDRTDLDADVFHLKARILNLSEYFLPQISIGTVGVSMRQNQFTSSSSVLFNPFLVATSRIPLFTESAILSLTVDAEQIYLNGEATSTFYNAGIDLSLFDEVLIVAAEVQGAGKKKADPIVNVAARIKLFEVLSVGAGQYNMTKGAYDARVPGSSAYFVGFVALQLPLGDWTGEGRE